MFHIHHRTGNRFVVVPPFGARISGAFERAEFDTKRRRDLLAEMQRLRGKVYLEDGAIRPGDLSSDGRHRLADDDAAWHVLSVCPDGRVAACLRYLDESQFTAFRGLWVSHSALARCPRVGWRLRMAVQSKMARARTTGLGFGSVGGWAVAPEHRGTMEGVGIVLATYGLLELLGGCLGVATATFRHRSAAILRKIGLNPLGWCSTALPPYYDPKYGCEMEILEFDSRSPNPRYLGAVEDFEAVLAQAPVLCAERPDAPQSPWRAARFVVWPPEASAGSTNPAASGMLA